MKKGFTLSEVLITLGVIGVVAAMTLPVLIQNYRNNVAETRLKKFYSAFNQAIQRSVAENGDYSGWDYPFVDLKDDDGNYIGPADQIDNQFRRYIGQYLNIAKREVITNSGNGLEQNLYYLADGGAFTVAPHQGRTITFYPTNPKKCLETDTSLQAGICSFPFLFAPHWNSYGGVFSHKGLEPYYYGWGDQKDESLYTNKTYGCKNGNGNFCTAIIARNGWKIPKDYPRKIKF